MFRSILKKTGRGLKLSASSLALLLMMLPALALLVRPISDEGPTGELRWSVVSLGLTLWDPEVWSGTLASLSAAVVVTLVSRLVGVRLGRAIGDATGGTRIPIAFLATLPLAAGPLITALGLSRFIEDWPGWANLSGYGIETPRSVWNLDQPLRWLCLLWIESVRGSAMVALATTRALRVIDPLWLDAAESLGGRRRTAWWPLVWPVIKPRVLPTLAAVFAATLFDPTASLVLGIDRSLPSQSLVAWIRDGDTSRASVLALLAASLCVIGRSWILPKGEPTPIPPRTEGRSFLKPPTIAERMIRLAWLGCWLALAIGPGVIGVIELGRGTTSRLLEADWLTGEAWPVVARSIGPATLALIVGLTVARGLSGSTSGQIGRLAARLARFVSLGPGLALAMGVGGLTWLVLVGKSLALPLLAGETGLAARLDWLATALHPLRNPWLLFAWAIALKRFGALFRLEADRRAWFRREWDEAALLLGASASRARRLTRRFPWSGLRTTSVLWMIASAATDLTLPIVISPAQGGQSLGPILLGSTRSSTDDSLGAWLAIILILNGVTYLAALTSILVERADRDTPGAEPGFILQGS